MQKFTRPLTREIELAGQRLALTFTETGLAMRPVGSRKPPREITWAALAQQLGFEGDASAPAAPSSPAKQAATGEVATLLERLERWLAQHRPRYLKGLRPGAAASALDQFQTQLGLRVPEDLRALLAWHNGQSDDFVGCLVDRWNLMGTEAILAARSELTEGGGQAAWVPFLDDDAGNYVVLDTSQNPAPVREFWAGQAEQPVVAPSLTAWLNDFVAAVERGEYEEEPERGEFLRKPK